MLNSFAFLRRPLVPVFWPSILVVGTSLTVTPVAAMVVSAARLAEGLDAGVGARRATQTPCGAASMESYA